MNNSLAQNWCICSINLFKVVFNPDSNQKPVHCTLLDLSHLFNCDISITDLTCINVFVPCYMIPILIDIELMEHANLKNGTG